MAKVVNLRYSTFANQFICYFCYVICLVNTFHSLEENDEEQYEAHEISGAGSVVYMSKHVCMCVCVHACVHACVAKPSGQGTNLLIERLQF